MDSTSRFVPTLDFARRAGVSLPPGEPFEQEKWAGLFVIAVVMRRRTWKDEIWAQPAAVAGLPRGAPPAPESFAGNTAATVESIGETLPCMACSLTPGKRRCRVCNGQGTLLSRGVPVACTCDKGYVQCPSCLGQTSTSRITLRYYEDTPASLRELWIPSHLPCYAPLFGLESAMEKAIDLTLPPPEELRCHDLTGRVGGSAYRGGERQVRPHFFGHDFGDTIDRALEQLKKLGGGYHVARYDIRAYAWPLLRLRWRNPANEAVPKEIALFFDRAGALQVFDRNA